MPLSYQDSVTPETATLVHFSLRFCLLLVFTGSLIFSGCSELSEYENQQVAEALSDSLLSTTESWDVEMEFLEQGQLKLILTGSRAVTIKNEQRSVTKISGPVYIEIYNEEGEADTFVNADSAMHYPEEALFELYGNVNVKAPEGKELRSESLQWERKSDRVRTSDFVIFITDADSIAAEGFFGNTQLTNYTLNEGGGRAVIE
ncbi:LPS export ABC transporter periplasmic protein LptC [Gracilimonas mengyeensis]|uniref:LPS export ABC transporter protein LptC n=1 Tax=Gracilimonas mengyeensis TaxID=1302730 RepID=A0A521FIC1_9BACT|nr:LPS export ABC transporter periplasmic protein LptC [Gracilimonas mengyeensis]SMO95401.1 LPS export ABC transporter protein LptC [Gracilimonas mengyeensis]